MKSLIWLSLGVTTLVALLMSLGFLFISPGMAGAVFFITMALEWIIMEPVNRILRLKYIKVEAISYAKKAKFEDAVRRQSVVLECEFCETANAVKVDLNGPNAFICTKCGNGNRVVTQFTIVRSANPLETMSPLDAPVIIDEFGDIDAEIEAEING